MINQIIRLHCKGILLLILFILLKIFSLTAKLSPLNPNILMYDVESICTWHLNVYLFCVYYCVALSVFV
jgi:hypothetical protein